MAGESFSGLRNSCTIGRSVKLFYETSGDTSEKHRNHSSYIADCSWPMVETAKASFSRTNQTAKKRGRQKKPVKIFLNFTYLHKTQPGQKTAWDFPNFFKAIYSPDVWEYKFGCRLKYLQDWRSYCLSNRQNRRRLVETCLRHFKSGDKASW